jgi:hypothetical protein
MSADCAVRRSRHWITRLIGIHSRLFVVNCHAKQNRECTLIDTNCCYRMNYLRITTLPVGIILNFKHARPEWERLVLTNDTKIDRDKGELIL